MAGFLSAFSSTHQQTSSYNNNMGGAASTGTQMSANDYESMAQLLSPDTRSRLPNTETALSLMEDFESLTLSDNVQGCCQCSKNVGRAAAVVTPHDTVEQEMSEQPFIYRKKTYCCLDCFFDAYVKQPGLCMWIDSLFSAAVKIKKAQIYASSSSESGGGGGGEGKRK